MLISILVLGSLIQGCSDDDGVLDEVSSLLGEEQVQSKFRTYKDLLDYTKNDRANLVIQHGVELLDYRYAGKIETRGDIGSAKSKLLSKDNLVPLYDSLNVFHIYTMEDVQNRAELYSATNNFLSYLQNCVDTIVDYGLEIVELDWLFKGKSYSSICLVDENNQPVYENLMSNIGTTEIITNTDSDFPRLRQVQAPAENSISGQFFQKAIYRNYFGVTVAWASVSVNMYAHQSFRSVTDPITKQVSTIEEWYFDQVSILCQNPPSNGYQADSRIGVRNCIYGLDDNANSGYIDFDWVAVAGPSGSFSVSVGGGAGGFNVSYSGTMSPVQLSGYEKITARQVAHLFLN